MSQTSLGRILIVIGIAAILLFALADFIGAGMLAGTFGLVQIIGTVLGIGLFVVGLVLLLRGRPSEPAAAVPSQEPARAEAPTAPAAPDDLTRIEGIGPKVQSILQSAGVSTYRALAATTPEKISAILSAAAFKAPFDPSTWPKQAELAAQGDWAALQAYQDSLVAGRGG